VGTRWGAAAEDADAGGALPGARVPALGFHRGLCYPHFGRWKLAGRPDHAAWVASADAVAVRQGVRCRLPGCRFPAMGKWRFCDTHNMHFAHTRASNPAATPADLLAWAARRQRSSAPRFDVRELPELVRLELQFALQCRHDARGARLEPVAFRNATRWVAELGVGSLLERSGRFFEHAAHERFASARVHGRGCSELAEHALPATPRELTRGLLERYLAHVHARELSSGQKRRLLGNLRTFLDDVRMHEWAPGLPGNATYFDGEIPRRSTRRLPRFIDEYVMGQIEHPDNLTRLPDHTTQTAIVILIETGLRSIDALRLPFDPITTDAAGAPYLVYTNHKLGREAVIPISQRLLAQIRRQQADVARRYPSEQRHYLLPRVRANHDGRLAFSWATLCRRLARWLAECEIRDATGRPVHVTPHQFRHTLATRLVNNEVPLDTVRRLLDHNSPEMTARYAQIKDQTLRREWERYQQRINIRGEIVALDPHGPLSDAAWTSQQRLIEMNEPVELSLVRIIGGLEQLAREEETDAT
jgi:integrase